MQLDLLPTPKWVLVGVSTSHSGEYTHLCRTVCISCHAIKPFDNTHLRWALWLTFSQTEGQFWLSHSLILSFPECQLMEYFWLVINGSEAHYSTPTFWSSSLANKQTIFTTSVSQIIYIHMQNQTTQRKQNQMLNSWAQRCISSRKNEFSFIWMYWCRICCVFTADGRNTTTETDLRSLVLVVLMVYWLCKW